MIAERDFDHSRLGNPLVNQYSMYCRTFPLAAFATRRVTFSLPDLTLTIYVNCPDCFSQSLFKIDSLDVNCFMKTWVSIREVFLEWLLRSLTICKYQTVLLWGHLPYDTLFAHSKPFPAIVTRLSLGISGSTFPLLRISSSFTVFLFFQKNSFSGFKFSNPGVWHRRVTHSPQHSEEKLDTLYMLK